MKLHPSRSRDASPNKYQVSALTDERSEGDGAHGAKSNINRTLQLSVVIACNSRGHGQGHEGKATSGNTNLICVLFLYTSSQLGATIFATELCFRREFEEGTDDSWVAKILAVV